METKSSNIFLTITIILAFLLTHVTSKASSSSSLCNGSAAECNSIVETEETTVIMESWSSQRMLGELDSISYNAMKGNQPACGGGKGGEPYSKTCPKTSSNPHKEGCSPHYKCRHDSS